MTNLSAIINISSFILLAITVLYTLSNIDEATTNLSYDGVTIKLNLMDQTFMLCMGHVLHSSEGNKSESRHVLTTASCLKHENIDYMTVSIKIIEF